MVGLFHNTEGGEWINIVSFYFNIHKNKQSRHRFYRGNLKRENHQHKLINKMNLQNCLFATTERMQNTPYIFPATIDKDATTPLWFSVYFNRQGCYDTLFSSYDWKEATTPCRPMACPSTVLPPWYDSHDYYPTELCNTHWSLILWFWPCNSNCKDIFLLTQAVA